MSIPVDRIATLCRQYPINHKTVFTSSRQVGYNLSSHLLMRGIAWANLDFTSPALHAAERYGPSLATEGWSQVTYDLMQPVILSLLDSDRDLRNRLLGSVKLAPGVIASLDKCVSGIRKSGNPLPSLTAETERSKAVLELVHNVEQFLEQHRYLDDIAMLNQTRKLASAEDSILADMAARAWSPLEREYLGKISNGNLHALDSDAASREINADIAVRLANGSASEATGVLREILDTGLPFDQVEIAYTSEKPYLSDLVNLAHWIPDSMSFANGVPAALSGPGRCLIGFLEWVAGGCRSSMMISLLRAKRISVRRVAPTGISTNYIAKHLTRLRAGDGVVELLRTAEVLQNEEGVPRRNDVAQPTLFDSPGRAERALDYRHFVEAVVQLVPGGKTCSLSTIANNCSRWLEMFAPVHSEQDSIVRESLVQRLARLSRYDLTIPVQTGHALLAKMFGSHKTGASVALSGRINVVPVEKAGLTGRHHIFIVGMDDETFPGQDRENYFLSLFTDELDLAHEDRRRERIRSVDRILTASNVSVTFVSQQSDPMDGSEIHPSPVVRQHMADSSTRYYGRHSDDDVAVRPSFGLTGYYQSQDFGEAVRLTYPWLASGQHASRERKSNRLGMYDGVLLEETPELDLAHKANVISASAMERLSGCAYRYFLQRVLRVRTPEDPPDDFAWLSSLQKGRLLHDLLYRYYEERRTDPDAESIPRRSHLMRLLDVLINEHVKENPAHNAAGYAADYDRLVTAADIFLSAEESDEVQGEPWALELRFGYSNDRHSWSDGPLEIPMGNDVVVNLRGAIDRVDRDGSEFRIWDYKSGSLFNFDELPLEGDLRHMQWAIYAYALEELLKMKKDEGNVVRSGYFFISAKGNGQRVSGVPPARDEMGKRLEPLVDLVSYGTFVHAHRQKGECRFCDFKPVCGGEIVDEKSINDLETVDERSAIAKSLARKWLKA